MALRNSRGLPTHQLSCPLSLPSDFAFCLRVRRRGGLKLQGDATTNSFMSDATIVNFFATMIGTLIIDILLVEQVLQRLGVACRVVRHQCADCHTDCMATGAQHMAQTAVSARAMPGGSMRAHAFASEPLQ